MKKVAPWIHASRPKTLPAAAIPVIIGGALASAGGAFSFVPWILCLAFALLIQVGTNYANDYYDFVKGADDDRRIGPQRAVASGWIRPGQMYAGMWITFAIAFIVGLGLVPYGGWMLLSVGILSILCGIAYTGGPYPLGYNGWGEVFVFIFFGWVATIFTYYVQAGEFSCNLHGIDTPLWPWLAGIVPGLLSTNLLVVNNVRDEPLDREAGKRTLAVRFGRKFGLWEYGLSNFIALAIPTVMAAVTGGWEFLLVLLAAPFVFRSVRGLILANNRESYQRILGQTAFLLILAGGLFATGLLLSA